jgi:hypothetical protein
MVGLLIGLTAIGVAVVALRLEHARHMRQIQVLQIQQTELRQKIWSEDMELARLRSPQMIRERAVRFGVTPAPEEVKPAGAKPAAKPGPAKSPVKPVKR